MSVPLGPVRCSSREFGGLRMLKRYGLIQLIVAILVFSAIPMAMAGPGGTDRPFKGEVSGLIQFGGEGNPDGLTNVLSCDEANLPGVPPEVVEYFRVTTFTSADGRGSHLGRTHLEFAHCPGLTGLVGGQLAMIAANGDVLYGEYDGVYAEDGIHVFVEFLPEITEGSCVLLNDAPCESTGRFADASGHAEMIAFGVQTDPDDPFVPWSWWATWTGGELSY